MSVYLTPNLSSNSMIYRGSVFRCQQTRQLSTDTDSHIVAIACFQVVAEKQHPQAHCIN